MGKEGIGGVDITYKGQLEGVVHLEGRMREWRVWREQKSVGWNGCMKMCRGWSRVEESVE